MMTKGIVPPHNMEAEQSVLGCMMLREDAIPRVLSELSADNFYDRRNQAIYKAIASLSNRNEPIDMVTVMQELTRMGHKDDAGGATYLASLTSIVPMVGGLPGYCRIIKDSSLGRKLLGIGQEMVAEIMAGVSPDQLVEVMSQQLIDAASQTGGGDASEHIGDIATRVFKQIEAACTSDDPMGVPTGFVDLDRRTFGLQPTDLIVLAARPGMGKSTLAFNIATNAAKQGHGVAIFSMEMGSDQVVYKILSSVSGVNLKTMRRGVMTDTTWPRLTRAVGQVSDNRIRIDDTPALSVPVLRAKAKLMAMKQPIDLIIVDYLQLMQAKAENRTQEVTKISGGLKALAKEMRVPVIALSQLNRSLENRSDKRPTMADIRESGAIEQDADLIWFMYRDDYYNGPDSPYAGTTELNIAKFRNGEPGKVTLGFSPEQSRFYSISTAEEPQH